MDPQAHSRMCKMEKERFQFGSCEVVKGMLKIHQMHIGGYGLC